MDVDKILEMLKTARAGFERGFGPDIFPRAAWWPEHSHEAGIPGWVSEALMAGAIPGVDIDCHKIVSRGFIDSKVRQNAEEAVASWAKSAMLLAAPHPPYRLGEYYEKPDRFLVWIDLPEIVKHIDMDSDVLPIEQVLEENPVCPGVRGPAPDYGVRFFYTVEASCYIVSRKREAL